MKDIFWTYPAEAENGLTIIVTGRDAIDKFRDSGKYIYRVNVSLPYTPLPDGMPEEAAAERLGEITDALLEETEKDKAAIVTGIYTGDGRRDWVLYTKSLFIFRNIFNRALADMPEFPFEISAEEDPDWQEYQEMKDATYVPPLSTLDSKLPTIIN